jgi:hypothetical protein
MVFTNQGLPSGPLHEDSLARLSLVRVSVISLWACAVGRMVFDSPFNGLSTLFASVCGTYTFMNDKRLEGCYTFMSDNLSICGSGGTQCMGPFMVICLINSVFDLFRLGSLWSAGLLTLFPGATFFILLSIMLQTYSFYACTSVYKDLIQPFDSPVVERPYARFEDDSSQRSSTGFVPFSGQGRRLG